MKHNSSNQKRFALCICCIFILSLMILPVQASRRSHGLAITLLVSGVGLQVGGTLMHTSAESRYEEYLSTTIQADIQSQKSDVVARENASVIMSRAGYGFIGLAVLLSIFNQLDNASNEATPSTQLRNNAVSKMQFPINFSGTPIFFGDRVWGESQMFSFRPHYDFLKKRVSLQYLHRF